MKLLRRAIRRLWLLATCDHAEHFCVMQMGAGVAAHTHRCKRCLQVFLYEEVGLLNGSAVPAVDHDFRATIPEKEVLN